MSQDYRFKYDRMRENDPAETARPGEANIEPNGNYQHPGHGRNLGFEWQDERRLFLSYSYLISCEFTPIDGCIILSFTPHVVTLKGVGLLQLYNELMDHLPKRISCADARYNSLLEKDQYAVNEILAVKSG